jgi:hypothetical protein
MAMVWERERERERQRVRHRKREGLNGRVGLRSTWRRRDGADGTRMARK